MKNKSLDATFILEHAALDCHCFTFRFGRIVSGTALCWTLFVVVAWSSWPFPWPWLSWMVLAASGVVGPHEDLKLRWSVLGFFTCPWLPYQVCSWADLLVRSREKLDTGLDQMVIIVQLLGSVLELYHLLNWVTCAWCTWSCFWCGVPGMNGLGLVCKLLNFMYRTFSNISPYLTYTFTSVYNHSVILVWQRVKKEETQHLRS